MLIIYGFSEKWMSWMKAYVFIVNLVVLVNGCPNQKIRIQWGFK